MQQVSVTRILKTMSDEMTHYKELKKCYDQNVEKISIRDGLLENLTKSKMRIDQLQEILNHTYVEIPKRLN